jgi:hypothetical protein
VTDEKIQIFVLGPYNFLYEGGCERRMLERTMREKSAREECENMARERNARGMQERRRVGAREESKKKAWVPRLARQYPY